MMTPDKKTKKKNILTAIAILAFMVFLFVFTLYNIGVFDRSNKLPGGGVLGQADGTAWMAMYSLNMMKMAIKICEHELYWPFELRDLETWVKRLEVSSG